MCVPCVVPWRGGGLKTFAASPRLKRYSVDVAAAAEGERGNGLLIASGNATYHKHISAKQIGLTRICFQTVLSITQ